MPEDEKDPDELGFSEIFNFLPFLKTVEVPVKWSTGKINRIRNKVPMRKLVLYIGGTNYYFLVNNK